jgi:hemolysin III
MIEKPLPPLPPPPTRREIVADGVMHMLGLGLGLPAAVAMVALGERVGQIVPAAIYAGGLLAMLGCSAAYNMLRRSPLRGWLRRFDHAAIFAMIAGTYTPFTTALSGLWAVALTGTIWSLAGLGIVAKLRQPRWIEPISTALYLALGWIGILTVGPFRAALEAPPLILLAIGGVLYSVGVIFHLWRRLPYQNAIWHGFVLLAAAVHYAAVLTVLLDRGISSR